MTDLPTDAIERCIFRLPDGGWHDSYEEAHRQLAALKARVAELREMLEHAAVGGVSYRGNCDTCEAIKRELSNA